MNFLFYMTTEQSKREHEKDLLCLLIIKNLKPKYFTPEIMNLSEVIHEFHETHRVLLTELMKSEKFKRLYEKYNQKRNEIIYHSNKASGATGERRTGTLF